MRKKRRSPGNRPKTGVGKGGIAPPKHTQFKPGQSGNPSGRPKRKPITDAYLAFIDADPKNLEAVVRAIWKLAKKGSVRAIAEITDRIEGKAVSHDVLDVNAGEELIRKILAGHKRAQARTEDRANG